MGNQAPARAAILLADGFEEIEAATPADVLRRAGVETVLVGVSGLRAKGSRGVVYAADAELAELRGDFSLAVIPGGMPGARNIADSAAARALVEKIQGRGGIVAAICAAPAVALAAWGLLSGKKATCYPGMEGMFPPDAEFSPERVVVDGKLVTSRGPGTALEFSLRLAGLMAGDGIAARLAGEMLA
ncbi:MAG: DJ-1/PfpI family protein [Planctomycetota bacterium]|jgi:4-methyl-5(b-hydroxyethyl)-thiazole monophosphate biosynthesis|nr:DJ-1/PfpI family protein [Planctomycetota bacterium]